MQDFISIYQTYDSFKAQLIKALLESENIDCFLKTNDASGVLPHLGVAQGGAQVFVKQEDFEKATTIINEEVEQSSN